MIVLALDSSAAASVALVERAPDGTETVLASRTEFAARKHAEFLGPALRAVMGGAPAPEAVVAGVGPGPFTGLRAGIATAIGYAIGIDAPVYGVPSHEGLALRVYEEAGVPADTPLLVATDARRKEVYWTLFGASEGGLPRTVAGPEVSAPAVLAGASAGSGAEDGAPGTGRVDLSDPGLHRVGRGFALYPDVLGAPVDYAPEALEPGSEWLARVALRRLAAGEELLPPVPLYLREADAKPATPRTSVLK